MRFLTITQPWATLVAVGAKRIETRSWAPQYRGLLGIHAAKGFPRWARETCFDEPFSLRLNEAGIADPDDLPRGAVVALVDLVDYILIQHPPLGDEAAFGDYAPGRYGWRFRDIRRLPAPIEATGHLGIWHDDALARRVRESLP